MKLHRHLHPPAGAGDRRQPGDRHRRAAGDPLAQRAPVPASSRARPSPCAPSTSAPAPTWCAASSPRRSSAPSPPPTASTTSSRRARRGSRPSTSASSSTSTPPTRSPTSARASNQVRADLPPEAEVPAINIEPSDAQFASMYLSFGSTILEDNQVTDYLIRVVQPRLSAIEGVQRADILGGRTFAMRAWLKPDRMAALNVSPAQVRAGARAPTTTSSAVGQTKGALVQVNLTATTDLQLGRRVQAAGGPPAGRRAGAARGRRRRGARRRGLRQDVRFSGETRGVHGRLGAAQRQLARRHRARARGDGDASRRELPTRHGGARSPSTRPSTSTAPSTRSCSTLLETLLIVVVVIFLFLGSLRTVLVPVVAIPVSLIGAVFLMQVFGFTLNLLTLLAIVLSVGLVVDDAIVVVENVERHMREGKTPLEAALVGARELVGPDHRHDHHAGRGLRADRLPGRPHRRALPRVRLHAGRRGVHLRHRGADAVADDVVAAARSRSTASGWFARAHRRGVRRAAQARYARALGATLARAAGGLRRCGSCSSLLVVPMYLFSPKELAPDRGPGRRLRRHRRAAPTRRSSRSRPTPTQVNRHLQVDARVRSQLPDHVPDRRLRRHARQAVGRAQAHASSRSRRSCTASWRASRASARRRSCRRRCRAPGTFPVEFVIASTASHEELLRFAEQLVQEAVKSGQFAFPPIIDVQHRSGQGGDRHRPRQGGGDGARPCSRSAPISASMLGGNFVNRFNIDGPQLQGDPADRARRPAHARPARATSTSPGPNGQLMPLSAPSRRCATGVEPRTLNRFQQLNAVKISRRGAALARRGAARARGRRGADPAAGLPRRLHRRVAPAAPGGRQVPAGDGPGASCSSSWCSRRSSTRSATRSSSSPARCRWRCSAR